MPRTIGPLLLAAAVFSASAQGAVAPCGTLLISEAVLQRLNEVRAHGRDCGPGMPMAAGPALVWNENLAAVARFQANEMAQLRRMGHHDGQNRDLSERLRAQGYRYASAMENVAVGYGSLEAVVDAWLDSAGHCRNLMSGAAAEIGIACVDGAGVGLPEEQRYWTLVLAAPMQPPKAAHAPIDGRITARREPPTSP